MSKSSLGIRIESDFSDYYDCKGNSDSIGVYRRYTSSDSRAKILRWLRGKDIKTVDIKAVKEFDNSNSKLVVYNNSSLHGFKGKSVMDIEEARELYPNLPASKFYEEANGETIKVLQIGSRRFRMTLKNEDLHLLKEGRVTDIIELTPQLNYGIMEPIFSIDYIFNGVDMLAVDFNKVQKLDTLGIQDIMTPEEVINEIRGALIAYNKF